MRLTVSSPRRVLTRDLRVGFGSERVGAHSLGPNGRELAQDLHAKGGPHIERERENAALVERIHGVHRENRGVYGSPRIYRGISFSLRESTRKVYRQ
jgi:hypothetical protein